MKYKINSVEKGQLSLIQDSDLLDAIRPHFENDIWRKLFHQLIDDLDNNLQQQINFDEFSNRDG